MLSKLFLAFLRVSNNCLEIKADLAVCFMGLMLLSPMTSQAIRLNPESGLAVFLKKCNTNPSLKAEFQSLMMLIFFIVGLSGHLSGAAQVMRGGE
jgi:hypothetical protein